MGERRHRAHVGSHVVSGETEGIRHLQTLTGEASRSIFEHASEGGEVSFVVGTESYVLRRNPDFTFTVELAHNHSEIPGT